MTTARNRWPASWAAKPRAAHRDTTDVFLESAWWDPITIAATGRALKINSDARYRFERGVDPAFTLPGLELATQMILDLCGGEAGTVVQDGAPPTPTRTYRLNPARVVSLVGMEIPEADPAQHAGSAWLHPERQRCAPPSWRPDVLGEADLVEEVARIASLTKLQGAPMARSAAGRAAPILTPLQVRERTPGAPSRRLATTNA
jgi:phenylalanyl-tRNA synthetase beta chain